MRPTRPDHEIKAIKEQISTMAGQFNRYLKEVERWRNTINYSSNEYNNSLWNMRHNQLTCAFLYARMKEFEEKEKTLRLLYYED